MRQLADAALIHRFPRLLGRRTREPGRLYLVGGASAVLVGWRNATIDVDIHLPTDDAEILRHIPALKDELQVNVELAASDAVEDQLYRYPAVDPPSFRRGVEEAVAAARARRP